MQCRLCAIYSHAHRLLYDLIANCMEYVCVHVCACMRVQAWDLSNMQIAQPIGGSIGIIDDVQSCHPKS